MTPAPDSYADRLVDNGVAIFLFHGVIRPLQTEVRNYTRKHLPVDDFVAVLRSLKARGTPVSMDDVIADRAGRAPLPQHAFAITFDDGFANNLTVAAPILAEEKVPATFYVTTDFIDRNRMSWIDRIEYAVEAVRQGSLRCPWAPPRSTMRRRSEPFSMKFADTSNRLPPSVRMPSPPTSSVSSAFRKSGRIRTRSIKN